MIKQLHRNILLQAVMVVLMVGIRCLYTHTIAYMFVLWNLFLAYIPLALSYYIVQKKNIRPTATIILGGLWLLFLPNAAYIITDLIYLPESAAAPIWFNVALLFSAGMVGLHIGICSLLFISTKLQQWFTTVQIHGIIIAVTVLSGFGIYLGRFLRYNSWDIISNPLLLAQNILDRVAHPNMHLRTWAVTVVFAVIQLVGYYFIRLIVYGKKELEAGME